MDGADNDWLFLSGFPHDLRPRGWVYFKVEGHVVARARVRRVGFRTDVREHTPDDHGVYQRVQSTPTLEFDPRTWEEVDFPAAETHQQGIRYVEANDDDDGAVHHLVGGSVIASHPLR